MLSVKTLKFQPPPASDPLWSSVVLLLAGNSPTFTDLSNSQRAPKGTSELTIASTPGSLAGGSTATTNVGRSSLAYDSSADFRTAGAWTLDFRIKATGPATDQTWFFMSSGNNRYFAIERVGGLNQNPTPNLTSAGWGPSISLQMTIDQWYWIRIVNTADNFTTLLVDGVPVSTQSNNTANSDPLALDLFKIPAQTEGAALRNVAIEQVRFTRAARSAETQPTQTTAWPTF